MKKFFCCLILVFIALSGCGKSSSLEQGEEVTEIIWWSGDGHSEQCYRELISEFNSTIGKQNNIKITLEVYSDYNRILAEAVANNSEPDFMGLGDYISFKDAVENELIVPLTSVKGLEKFLENNYGCYVEGKNMYHGEIYGINNAAILIGLVYNKDMFVEAGLVDEQGEAKPPATIDEMVAYAHRLTDYSENKFGFIMPMKWNSWFRYELQNPSQSITGMKNGVYDLEEQKIDFNGIKPLAEAYLQMKKNGSIYPGEQEMSNEIARAIFSSGNVGMKMCAIWDIGVFGDQFLPEFDWGVAPIPGNSEGDSYSHYKEPSTSLYISKKALEEKNPEKVAIAYSFIYGDYAMQKLYRDGVNIPWRAELITDENLENTKVGWSDFGKILKLTELEENDDNSGLVLLNKGIQEDFINNVWSGTVSLDEWIEKKNGDE